MTTFDIIKIELFERAINLINGYGMYGINSVIYLLIHPFINICIYLSDKQINTICFHTFKTHNRLTSLTNDNKGHRSSQPIRSV